MGVRLIFLGTGGWISIPNRAFPSIVLDVGDVYYMIDAGEACSRQFMKTELNPYKLKVIFITHHHGDHTLGLPGLAINLYKMGVTEKETIKVYAPYWCEKHIKGLFNYGGLKESVILGFHFFKETLGKNKVYSDKNIDVYAKEMEHSVPSVAYKFIIKASRKSKVIVYSGDTKPTSKLVDFSYGADILIHEASFDEGYEELAVSIGHSTVKHAIETAIKAKAKMLILFHLGLQEFSRKEFKVNSVRVIVPSDLEEIVLE